MKKEEKQLLIKNIILACVDELCSERPIATDKDQSDLFWRELEKNLNKIKTQTPSSKT
jgi:hypothetical protein